MSWFWDRAVTAIGAAYNTFKLVYSNPAVEQARAGFESRSGYYDLLLSYYNNDVFNMLQKHWGKYREDYGLYRNTRSIYNPTRRLCDFYAAQVYPGSLPKDGENLPEGVKSAIPFSSDTDKRLKKAVAQFWTWSNFASLKTTHVRQGAILGSQLAELIDDVAGGKVYVHYVWPGFVVDLKLDNRGNVKRYVLEYRVEEETPIVGLGGQGSSTSKSYLYRKEVDEFQETIYHDNKVVSQIELPYGFCNAVWYKHSDIGGVHGQPQISGSLVKLNELNSRASQLNDQIGKVVANPMMITSQYPQQLQKLFGNTKRGATDDLDGNGQGGNSNSESQQYFTGPADADIKKMVGDLDIPGALSVIDKMYSEIEADNPEITFWSKLREMSTLTGPAAERLSGDVIGKVTEAQGLYDQANIRLFQMAVAIGGFRANEGRQGWANPTDAQKKFKPFGLDSYERGKLDMDIMPRPLVPPTAMERSSERVQYWTGLTAEKGFGIPEEIILEDEGWTPERIQQVTDAKAAAAQRQQEMFAQAGAAGQGNQTQGKQPQGNGNV
jgi:hypothetical protein